MPAMPAPAPRRSPALIPARRADLCLEFANTRFWRGAATPTETLRELGDVLDWCARQGALDPPAARALKRGWPDGGRGAAFAGALALREAIYRVFAAIARGKAPGDADLDVLARALDQAPRRAKLKRTEAGFVWRVERLDFTVADTLAAVLWSAGDLLAGPKLGRVRLCANPQCRWLFLDESKSGTRRWCSMSACGNRAKAHRHYVKSRKR